MGCITNLVFIIFDLSHHIFCLTSTSSVSKYIMSLNAKLMADSFHLSLVSGYNTEGNETGNNRKRFLLYFSMEDNRIQDHSFLFFLS